MIYKLKDDWPELLFNSVALAEKNEFKYGKHDCCMFASNIVMGLTEPALDLCKGFRGYKTAKGALKMLKKHNCKDLNDLADLMIKKFGLREVPIGFAKRNNLVIGLDKDEMPTVGVCMGAVCAFTGEGIIYTPTNQILRAIQYG